MKVVFLAAGAGGMYCGSCLRDNRVASVLLQQGRDVILIPLYTPIRTDELDVSDSRVFYGGINVYLRQKSRVYRSLPRWVGRMLDAPVVLRRAMRLAGDARPDDLGALTLSVLKGEDGAQQRELQQLLDALREMKPDVIVLPNLMFVGLASSLKTALRAAVLCTLSGEDVFLDRLSIRYREEAFRLVAERARDVDGFVAVTEYFARHAAGHFALPEARVHVVPMGVKVDDVGDTCDELPERFTIGYLARVCEEKGLEQLADALIALRSSGRDVCVRAAGYLGPADRPYLDRIHAKLKRAGMENAFEYVGEVDRAEKLAFIRGLHVLSVPTVYHEAKGLYVLEALACGVPVVQPNHGSFPELVGATGGGLLYDPTERNGLTDAIARMMDDESLRRRLGAAGRAVVHHSYTDAVMADSTWALCGRIRAESVGPAIANEPKEV